MIFVAQNFNLFLANLVTVLSAEGAGLGHGRSRPLWMRIKVFPGQAAAVPHHPYEEIASRSPPAEIAARWHFGLPIKNWTHITTVLSQLSICFDQEPLRCL